MFLRSPAVRRWPWSTARSPRRKLAAGTAELRTPGCWPSPTSARRSGRTPPAGTAAWSEGWGWTPRTSPAPPRMARRSALLPCRRPARSVPRPFRGSLSAYLRVWPTPFTVPPPWPPHAHLLPICRGRICPPISASLTLITCALSRTKKPDSARLDRTRSTGGARARGNCPRVLRKLDIDLLLTSLSSKQWETSLIFRVCHQVISGDLKPITYSEIWHSNLINKCSKLQI